ncbi:MAG: 4a-hydroxytetrahydrobiopterin dehydratase [Armatimonadetes bacterium]|nr:4a-hydroxytetrahydrobiopterin dehydratase [Armatimonadota bacterium]
MPKLTENELREALSQLDGWSVEGGQITKTYEFDSYALGLLFASGCGHLAEQRDHHPDLLITWRRVKVSLATHSEGGITEKDVGLADAYGRLADGLR